MKQIRIVDQDTGEVVVELIVPVAGTEVHYVHPYFVIQIHDY